MFKGKKMAGHLGAERVTVQSLEVVSTDPEEGLILVKGGVPGAKGGWIRITDAKKRKPPDDVPLPAGLKGVVAVADAAGGTAEEPASEDGPEAAGDGEGEE